MKTCSRCKVAKERGEFYSDASKKDGMSSRRKGCCKADAEKWRVANLERHNASVRAWRAANPERTRAQPRIQREKWGEQRRAHGRRYHARERERLSGLNRAYKESHREEESERGRKWRERNRPRLAEKEARRRALKRRSQIEPVDYESIVRRDGRICHIRGSEISDASWPDRWSLSFDHVVPLANGGPHISENIKPSHLRCNMSKGARL